MDTDLPFEEGVSRSNRLLMKILIPQLGTMLALVAIILPLFPAQANDSENLPPVVVTSLRGEYVTGAGVLLSWRTPAPNDGPGFEILRSTDGVHFRPVGFAIDPVDSNGNQPHRYWDTEVAPGYYHYRLRALGSDRSAEVSETVSLDVRPAMAINMYVYPDRNDGIATIGLTPNWIGQQVGVEVVRNSGQPVTYYTHRVDERVSVPVRNLGPGTYTVRISAEDRTVTRHVVVR